MAFDDIGNEIQGESFWSKAGNLLLIVSGAALVLLLIGLGSKWMDKKEGEPSFWKEHFPNGFSLDGVKSAAKSGWDGLVNVKDSAVDALTGEADPAKDPKKFNDNAAKEQQSTEKMKSLAGAAPTLLGAGVGTAVAAETIHTKYIAPTVAHGVEIKNKIPTWWDEVKYKTQNFLASEKSFGNNSFATKAGTAISASAKPFVAVGAVLADSKIIKALKPAGGLLIGFQTWGHANELEDDANRLEKAGKEADDNALSEQALKKRSAALAERLSGLAEGGGYLIPNPLGILAGSIVKNVTYIASGANNSGGVTRDSISEFVGKGYNGYGLDAVASSIMSHGVGALISGKGVAQAAHELWNGDDGLGFQDTKTAVVQSTPTAAKPTTEVAKTNG